jgi:hypothetical protein
MGNMAEMIKQEIRKTGNNSYDKIRRNTEIEYTCGCKYNFDHHITLKNVCPEHERELVASRS